MISFNLGWRFWFDSGYKIVLLILVLIYTVICLNDIAVYEKTPLDVRSALNSLSKTTKYGSLPEEQKKALDDLYQQSTCTKNGCTGLHLAEISKTGAMRYYRATYGRRIMGPYLYASPVLVIFGNLPWLQSIIWLIILKVLIFWLFCLNKTSDQ